MRAFNEGNAAKAAEVGLHLKFNKYDSLLVKTFKLLKDSLGHGNTIVSRNKSIKLFNGVHLFKIYHPDGVFMPNSSQPLRGRKEIEAYFKSDMADGVCKYPILRPQRMKLAEMYLPHFSHGSNHYRRSKWLWM